MIDSVLNLVFRCSHKRITRPMTPVHDAADDGETYVVCLDCGKRFPYDLKTMRVRRSPDEGKARKSRLFHLFWVLALPAGWVILKVIEAH